MVEKILKPLAAALFALALFSGEAHSAGLAAYINAPIQGGGALGLSLGSGGFYYAPPFYANGFPPPILYEDAPQVAPGYQWVRGHWQWTPYGYRWVSGHPRPIPYYAYPPTLYYPPSVNYGLSYDYRYRDYRWREHEVWEQHERREREHERREHAHGHEIHDAGPR